MSELKPLVRNRGTLPRRVGLLGATDVAPSRNGQRYPYAVGDRIAGDLTVIGHLAEGRHGHLYQVWSASDWCAFTCKILSPDKCDDRRARAALRREARILRGVRHPNIIRFFGEGEHQSLPFLLMEFLDGPSIFDLLESTTERKISTPDALRTAIHIGAALQYLHRRGWLHLDLKPANLLLRDCVPVLVDFDAARPIEPTRKALGSQGTAPYMSPEQARRGSLNRASDVYGLAALLYEMLTGRWPYEDVYTGDDIRLGDERQFPQLGTMSPPAPSRFNPNISPSLESMILKCLASDPEQRFTSMHHMLLALAAELDEPVALWPRNVRTERRREPRD